MNKKIKPTQPVRLNNNLKLYEYFAALLIFFVLFNVYTASVVGLNWLWPLAAMAGLFTLAYAWERKRPSQILQFLVQLPVMLIGPIWFMSIALTLWAGDRLHGMWLLIFILAALNIVVANILILKHIDIASIIKWMMKSKLIQREKDCTYFSLPYYLPPAANVPEWLDRFLRVGRYFWIAVMVLGAIFFAPGVYSSVGIENRLLNVSGTLGLGFSVLFSRLWQIPLFRRIQKRFGQGEDAWPVPEPGFSGFRRARKRT